MPIHAILHANIRTPRSELAACRDFYCNVLGLTAGASTAIQVDRLLAVR